MRKFVVLFFLIFAFVPAKSFASAIVVDKIVATVEGQPITAYEIENISGFYGIKNTKALINKIIDDYVVMYYAKKSGVIVTDEDVEKYIENMAKRNGMSVDMFLQKLKDSGIDLDYYKLGIKLGLYRRKFAMRMFAPTIHITQAEIKRYYKLHKNEFKANPVLVMSIISLRSKKLAEDIYNQLQQGADFNSLKDKFSLDKEPAKAIPLSAFNKTIRNELARLSPGQISNIIESGNTYYIVKLIDEKGNSVNFDAVKDRIRDIIFAKKIEAKLSSWVKMVKARTDIEIFG